LGSGQVLSGWDYYLGVGTQDYGVRRNPEGGIVQGQTFTSWSVNGSTGFDLGDTGRLRLTGLYFIEDPEDFYGTDFTQVSGSQLAGSAFIAQPPNPFADQAQTEQTVLSLSYDQSGFLGHALNVTLYWHDEREIQRAADFFDDGDPDTSNVFYFDSDAENQRLGLRTTLNYSLEIGANVLEASYGLDALRQRYYRPVVDPADGDVINYISPEVVLDSVAVLVQPQYRHGAWLFTGGVRHEWFDGEVGSEGFDPSVSNAATPGETPGFDLSLFNLGAVYELTPDVQIYGGFSQGAEVSEFGRAARGASDPSLINLDAAASDQYELGLRGRRGMLDFSLAAFYSESDKAALLQRDPSCAGQPLCPLIPLRIAQEFYGLEATADWVISAAARLGTVLTYQQGERQEPGAAAIPVATDTISPPRATVYFELAPLAKWDNRLQATYFARTNEYGASEEAAGLRDSDEVFLMDFTSSYPLAAGRVSLGIANLLNEKYVNVTNAASGDFFYYLSEGTRATLGYTVKF
jgi:iron complex outermembrane receptor protein